MFVTEAAWQEDRSAFRGNLIDLARACHQHRIGLMVTIGGTQAFINEDRTIDRDRVQSFVEALVAAVGREPALAFWDASKSRTTKWCTARCGDRVRSERYRGTDKFRERQKSRG